MMTSANFFRRRIPYVCSVGGAKRLEKKFAANGFDNISTDPHINHSVITARGADKNPARTLHLESLFDQNAFVGLSHAGCHHPGRGATSGGTRCRIFTVIKDHSSV